MDVIYSSAILPSHPDVACLVGNMLYAGGYLHSGQARRPSLALRPETPMLPTHPKLPALRQLAPEEFATGQWVHALKEFLNTTFRSGYESEYSSDQLSGWLTRCPNCFVVFVQKAELKEQSAAPERIVACVKIMPLLEDVVLKTGGFDSYTVLPEQLAPGAKGAAAVWVGDLISTNRHLGLLLRTIGAAVKGLLVPVYCRTQLGRLAHILIARYGATVLRHAKVDSAHATVLALAAAKLPHD